MVLLRDLEARLIEAARDWDSRDDGPGYWEITKDLVPEYLTMMSLLVGRERTPALYLMYHRLMWEDDDDNRDAEFLIRHGAERLRELGPLSPVDIDVLDRLESFWKWADNVNDEFDELVSLVASRHL